ncbi:MAG: hypothetical protein HFG02_10645 [Oscillibacter sp.]|nr:hypothetical protein [Oscillibacter sp.]
MLMSMGVLLSKQENRKQGNQTENENRPHCGRAGKLAGVHSAHESVYFHGHYP